jgi:hypothetical protein
MHARPAPRGAISASIVGLGDTFSSRDLNQNKETGLSHCTEAGVIFLGTTGAPFL